MKNTYTIFLTLIYLLLMSIFWQIVSADESYKDGQKLVKRGEFERAIEQANKSIIKNPREPRYYYGRAKILLASTLNLGENAKLEFKNAALEDLKMAQELNPKNLVTLRNIVPLYYYLGVEDLQKPAGKENVDLNFTSAVENYYKSIKHYSPNDVGIYALLAKYEKRLGFDSQLEESIKNIQRLRPDLLEWYITL